MKKDAELTAQNLPFRRMTLQRHSTRLDPPPGESNSTKDHKQRKFEKYLREKQSSVCSTAYVDKKLGYELLIQNPL